MDKRDQFDAEGSGAPSDPLVGRVLNGRFDIQEPIGEGGMGKVYRAIQTPLGRQVAVKVLHPTLPSSQDPNFQRRFLQEAALTARLHHPNTVTVIDYGQSDDGIYFLAMEFLEGRTLAQALVESGPLPWQRAVSIAQQICRSLKEAHAQGVVHRDLKPANIMLCSDGDDDLVKVLDFGLVKTVAGDGVTPQVEVTQRGTFIGSPQYMSPEQARNESDARSDIYSLGVLLYHMLSGRPPFVSQDYIELLFAHHRQPVPHFEHVRAGLQVPPPLEAVVRKCLEKTPAARYQSMEEVLEALKQASVAAGANSGLFKSPASSGVFKQPVAVTGPLFSSISKATDEAPGKAEGSDRTRAYNLAADIGVVLPEKVKAQGSTGPGTAALAAVAALVVVVVGLGGWFILRKSPAPSAAPPPAPVATAAEAEPTPAPAPAEDPEPAPARAAQVRFRVMSDPVGARVYYRGRERGRTPFVLELPAGPEGIATVELTFTAEGHVPETVLTGGSGDVVVMQKLQRRGASRRADRGGSDEPVAAVPAGPAPVVKAEPTPAPAAPSAGSAALPPATAQAQVALAAHAASKGMMGVPASATTAPRPSGEEVLPFGEGMEPPAKLEGKDIVYPRAALTAGVQGSMIIKCTISTQGRVSNCRVLKSLPFMEEPVLDALTSSVYRPVTFGGKPVAVDYVFNVRITGRR